MALHPQTRRPATASMCPTTFPTCPRIELQSLMLNDPSAHRHCSYHHLHLACKVLEEALRQNTDIFLDFSLLCLSLVNHTLQGRLRRIDQQGLWRRSSSFSGCALLTNPVPTTTAALVSNSQHCLRLQLAASHVPSLISLKDSKELRPSYHSSLGFWGLGKDSMSVA